jgi:hypothetical protein
MNPLAGMSNWRTPPALIVQRENRPSEARVIVPVPKPPSGTPEGPKGLNNHGCFGWAGTLA